MKGSQVLDPPFELGAACAYNKPEPWMERRGSGQTGCEVNVSRYEMEVAVVVDVVVQVFLWSTAVEWWSGSASRVGQ